MSENLIRTGIKLMEDATTVYLTTIDGDGYPNTRAMLNLRNPRQYPLLTGLFEGHEEDMLIYFTTNTSSIKIEQIIMNPSVSAYYCKPDEFHGMMLAGKIEIVDDTELKKRIWQEGWETYYRKGVEDPDYAILKLKPVWGKGWYQSDRFELRLDMNE